MASLATTDDLANMWRPLSTDELPRATDLLARASALLRQAEPHVDDRIAAFTSDPTDRMALDPVLVATVVATIVKRFISNVEGVASQSVGPYSVSYALRTEKEVRGELQVTVNDLAALRPKPRAASRVGSIRVRPSMAPPPFGTLGPIMASVFYDSALCPLGDEPVVVEAPTLIGDWEGFA